MNCRTNGAAQLSRLLMQAILFTLMNSAGCVSQVSGDWQVNLPMEFFPPACEKARIPCDFYVKTLHTDDYPSATPKHLQKDYLWFGGEGYYDNMWCSKPEETIEFAKCLVLKTIVDGCFSKLVIITARICRSRLLKSSISFNVAVS